MPPGRSRRGSGFVQSAARAVMRPWSGSAEDCSRAPARPQAVRFQASFAAVQRRPAGGILLSDAPRRGGAVAKVVGIRGWRNLRVVPQAKTGVGAPAEITP